MTVATGCRRGELLALTWTDVDFDHGVVDVSKSLEQTREGLCIKTTKTGKSRAIPIPRFAIEELKEHRSNQNHWLGMFKGDYRSDLDLVISTPEGNYLKPDSVTTKVCLLARSVGLKASLHTLRHSHASELLSKGVPLPTVSKRLGHSSVNVTAKVYSHSFSADEIRAAEVIDTALRNVVQREELKN